MVTKNLIGLAKSGTATSKTPATKKPVAKKPVARKVAAKKPVVKPEPVLTPEQKRDIKAKERVEELLQGVNLSLDKKEDLLEFEDTPVAGDSQNLEWLQEQISLLTKANEQLRSDLEAATIGGPAPRGGDAAVKQSVISLFDELQENYNRMGVNFEVRFPAFLNRMIMFFPFLSQYKKYR